MGTFQQHIIFASWECTNPKTVNYCKQPMFDVFSLPVPHFSVALFGCRLLLRGSRSGYKHWLSISEKWVQCSLNFPYNHDTEVGFFQNFSHSNGVIRVAEHSKTAQTYNVSFAKQNIMKNNSIAFDVSILLLALPDKNVHIYSFQSQTLWVTWSGGGTDGRGLHK